MRITFVLGHAGLSGGVRVVAEYARRLRARGHSVCIVSRSWSPPGRKEKAKAVARRLSGKLIGGTNPNPDPSHLDGVNVEHRVIPGAEKLTPDMLPESDIIIATWWETAEWISDFPESAGTKVYFLQHFETHEGQPVHRVRATWKLPFHKIAVSRWLVDLARDEFNDPDVALVPNSVDHDLFYAPRRGKQEVPTVGFMYADAPFKGCDLTIEAVRQAQMILPALRVFAFGWDHDAPLPEGTIYRCQPEQDQLRTIYGNCDAWLFASRTEGFGLPLLEAMACHTPVIATPTGAAPELCDAGGGWLVKHEEPEHMAEAIVRLATLDDQAWRATSRRAREIVTDYSWAEAADRFEAALRAAREADKGSGRHAA